MRWTFHADLDTFRGQVEPFLSARPERNLLATILLAIRDGRYDAGTAVLAAGIDADNAIAAVALRTPPFCMLCTELADPADAAGLIETWLTRDPEVCGVNAGVATARAVAAEWSRCTGGATRSTFRTAHHQLDVVTGPSRPAAGRLRPASESDRPLAIDWWAEFAAEARIHVDDPAPAVDQRLRIGGLYLWEDGEPVVMVAVNPQVAGIVRVGPVYTPPAHRCHGYASSAVAAVSSRVLAEGARACTLFTDLANPTSNRIYADVGYRRGGEWEEIAFAPAG